MTTYYVLHTGSNTAPYDTWAKAATSLETIALIPAAAGDTVYVRSTHSQTQATALSMAWAGTAASPIRIIGVSDSNEPPTTTASGAVIEVTGANNLTPASGGYVYMSGIRFRAGSSTNQADIIFTNGTGLQYYDNCQFELAGNNSGSDIIASTSTTVVLNDCTIKMINSGSRLGPSIAHFTMRGGSFESGTLSNPLCDSGTGAIVLFEGVDMSNLPTSVDIFTGTTVGMDVTMRNGKMPASWSGSIFASASTVGQAASFRMYNCSAGDTNYALEVKTEFGAVTHETAIYRTGGASNGTTPISWKMVSGANAEWMHQTLDSPEIVIWNTAVGSSKTVTVEFIIDSAVTLYKEDVWMEVQYLGTSGFPLSVFDNDSRLATYLTALTTTACDSGTGLANWTGDSGSGNSYKLVSTITPQEVGFIHVVVKLAKASTTIYVDPKITIA